MIIPVQLCKRSFFKKNRKITYFQWMNSTVYESYPNLKNHIVRVAKAWAESTIAMMMPGPWAMLMSKKLLHLQEGGKERC